VPRNGCDDGFVRSIERQFAGVGRSLRQAVIAHYASRGEPLDHPAGLRTLDTNSTLVPVRASILLRLLARRGLESVAGLDVVDLGCGFGALSVYLGVAGARVTGIDPNADRMSVGESVARQYGLDVSFQPGWMEALRLDDMQFDIAIMNNSLCYVIARSDRRRALGHSLRVLRPDGWLVVRDPARAAPLDPFSGLPLVHQLPVSLARQLPSTFVRHRSNVRLRTRFGQARELRSAGYVEVRAERLDEPLRRPRRYQHFTARRPRLD
jgi:SAM-dependent methyltransferase